MQQFAFLVRWQFDVLAGILPPGVLAERRPQHRAKRWVAAHQAFQYRIGLYLGPLEFGGGPARPAEDLEEAGPYDGEHRVMSGGAAGPRSGSGIR
ncbi:hypothetical protein Alo02nite_91510 [Actinoplanes lobatus]|uniref:Uncharacterized protein n=1 Tax=Actinoplanes lobatus TaxID=113568 RepID=A0ABQ4AZ96_9ACTN|nr:hypothetical protein Alo02nite_91510 [Actinoplanes lobatus]